MQHLHQQGTGACHLGLDLQLALIHQALQPHAPGEPQTYKQTKTRVTDESTLWWQAHTTSTYFSEEHGHNNELQSQPAGSGTTQLKHTLEAYLQGVIHACTCRFAEASRSLREAWNC